MRSSKPGIESEIIPGYRVRYNPLKNAVAISIHYTADPAKRDPRWAAAVKKQSPSYHDYRREYELDWSSPAGNPFYPEFSKEWEKYVLHLPELIGEPVYRAWDFGYRHPACLWFQYSKKSGRLWILRECMPSGIDTFSFRDLVSFLSGSMEYEHLHRRPRAIEWLAELDRMQALGDGWDQIPKPPWFPQGVRFIDVSGPEATKIFASTASEPGAKSDYDILQAGGIQLMMAAQRVSDGENIIRRLLMDAPDGTSGMFIDPACPLLIQGLKGGIAFPKPTKTNPIPTNPYKDGFYENLHDCLRYGVVAAVPLNEQGEISREEVVGYTGQREPILRGGAPQEEVLDFVENRRDLWE